MFTQTSSKQRPLENGTFSSQLEEKAIRFSSDFECIFLMCDTCGSRTSSIWAAAFIYDVAAVKKIDGVPQPRFNLFFQVSALFHHEWPRFHHEWSRFNLVLNLPRFWSPPISFWSRFAGETNISTNPAWRHILSSSSQIHAVAHMVTSAPIFWGYLWIS